MIEISCVLPVYNGEKYLELSIESVLKQSFKNWELIIVDDGSTDSTPEILKKYIDPRIKVITTPNRKLPAALNTGFSHANGKYFTWTSHDNIYHQEAFQKMYDAIQNFGGIVHSWYQVIDEHGAIQWVGGAALPDNLQVKNNVGPCFLYPALVHQIVGGFDETAFLAEDWDFWIKSWEHGVSFKLLRESLYYYRQHSETLCNTKRFRCYLAYSRMIGKHSGILAGLLHFVNLMKWQLFIRER